MLQHNTNNNVTQQNTCTLYNISRNDKIHNNMHFIAQRNNVPHYNTSQRTGDTPRHNTSYNNKFTKGKSILQYHIITNYLTIQYKKNKNVIQ